MLPLLKALDLNTVGKKGLLSLLRQNISCMWSAPKQLGVLHTGGLGMITRKENGQLHPCIEPLNMHGILWGNETVILRPTVDYYCTP
jgi:hypothetical protein